MVLRLAELPQAAVKGGFAEAGGLLRLPEGDLPGLPLGHQPGEIPLGLGHWPAETHALPLGAGDAFCLKLAALEKLGMD